MMGGRGTASHISLAIALRSHSLIEFGHFKRRSDDEGGACVCYCLATTTT